MCEVRTRAATGVLQPSPETEDSLEPLEHIHRKPENLPILTQNFQGKSWCANIYFGLVTLKFYGRWPGTSSKLQPKINFLRQTIAALFNF